MRLYTLVLAAIFAPSKQIIMKGKYINTVIMMAAKSGKTSKQQNAHKETIQSLNDFKIIWSKNGKNALAKAEPALL
jgi:hypothetical protein